MKRITLTFACLSMLIYSCTEKKADAPATENAAVTLPMEVTYGGTPAIGSWDNVKTVMEWNKRLSQLNLDLGDLLADSLKVQLADGMTFDLPQDSALAVLKEFAGQVNSIQVVYVAAIPVNNVDKNDEWVLSWTDETFAMKDGSTDHQFIHEDYLMKAGKIREIVQYARKEAVKE